MKKYLFLLFVLLPLSIFSQVKPSDTDGDGFYNISTLNELKWITENDSCWTWNFELDNDIDASATSNWNMGDHDNDPATPDEYMGWQPIGENLYNPYIGEFNGNGFTISNLYINRPGYDWIGVFGYIDHATTTVFETRDVSVYALKIANADIIGNSHVGGIVGHAKYIHIHNCSFNGSISSVSPAFCCTAGIIGYSYYCILYSCEVEGEISAFDDHCGGLAGYSVYSKIFNSKVSVNFSSQSDCGSLVGYGHDLVIESCLSLSTISNLVGNSNANSIKVYSTFWNLDLAGTSSNVFGIGKTTSELKNAETYKAVGWNFDFIWKINGDYPYIDVDFSKRPKDLDNNGFYEIRSFDDLRWISESGYDRSKKYELIQDINAAESYNINNGRGLLPIAFYSGEINGNGYSIDKLCINRPDDDYVALFGYGAHTGDFCRNLDLTNVSMFGNNYVASLIAHSNWYYNWYYSTGGISVIENCNVSGNVSGNMYVGGLVDVIPYHMIILNCTSECDLVGKNNNSSTLPTSNLIGGIAAYNRGMIYNSQYINGTVEGHSNLGGLCGQNIGSIYNSRADCNLIGDSYIGGFCYYNSGFIINCSSSGSVEGDTYIGGFSGINSGISINCYSTSKVKGNNFVGGFNSGYSANNNIIHCVWDKQVSGVGSSVGGKGLTTNEMMQKSTYTNLGWNFDYIWDITSSYPYINIDRTKAPKDLDYNGFLDINSYEDLKYIALTAYELESDLELKNDINASDDSDEWYALIGNIPIPYFKGVFNGNLFSISNWLIDHHPYYYSDHGVGLFRSTKNAVIRNVKMDNLKVESSRYSGGIAGVASNTLFENCSVEGTLNGYRSGGIVAISFDNSKIKFCSVDATFNKNHQQMCGGLIGMGNADIEQSCSFGTINNSASCGGLAGYLIGDISNSYSRVDLSNKNGTSGGVIGVLNGYKYVKNKLINCYSAGNVNGSYGLTPKENSASNCFWDSETSGTAISKDGDPRSTLEMKTKSTFTDVGWDFYTIWSIDPTINDGYPYLLMENVLLPPNLIFPYNNSEDVFPLVTFKWDSIYNAEKYELLVSLDSDFDEIVISREVLDTTYTVPTELQAEKRYYWKVRAINIVGPSGWSETWSFTTQKNPEKIILISPENETINRSIQPEFLWYSDDLATSYTLEISDSYDFENIIHIQEGVVDTTFDQIQLEHDKEYFWRVTGFTDDRPGETSDIWKFTTILPQLTLLAPKNGITNIEQYPVLEWEELSGYKKYKVQVAINPDFLESSMLEQAGKYSTEYQTTLTELSETYYWRARVEDEGGKFGEWSEIWNFKTGISKVVLISPEDKSEDIEFINRKFKWHDVKGADYYHLQISANSDFTQLIFSRDSITQSPWLVDELMPRTQYWWRVKAWNQETIDTPVWSEEWSFITDDIFVELRYPSDNSNVDIPLQMKWVSSPSEMDGYTLQVCEDDNFLNCVFEKELDGNNLYQLLKSDIQDIETSKTYYWRVCGKYKNTNTNYTAPWSFTIGSVGIEDVAEEIIISPQPANEILTVNLQGLRTQIESCKLIDINGRVVFKDEYGIKLISGNEIIKIDCSEFVSGKYFLIFETNQGKVVKEIMIEK